MSVETNATDNKDRPAKGGPSSPRRRFLKNAAGAAGAGCLIALGSGLVARQGSALPPTAIRPPGALPEADFLGACVRCGLCVRACPFDTLKLGAFGDGVVPGTPYFEARDIPCEMCPDIPCVVICPTGALDHGLTNIDEARMGLAVLIDQENCLNFLGLRCDVCYRVCPVIDKAITLELQHNPRSDRHALLLPTVHSDACTGCGKCEKACILPQESAIKVLPRHLAQSKRSEHYRRGWEEKEKAGHSLIGDQVQYPVRGLEDRAFGDTRDVGQRPPAPPAGNAGSIPSADSVAPSDASVGNHGLSQPAQTQEAQDVEGGAWKNGGLKSDWKP